MNEDLKEFLRCLNRNRVEFLIIGAHALAFHGLPRFTEDLDLWLSKSKENARRLSEALSEFGTPFPEGGEQEWLGDRKMIRLGHPPNRIDLLNFGPEIPFEVAYARGLEAEMEGVPVTIICREDFIRSKRDAGRAKDLRDLEEIGEA
ncbi:MAG: nucleotidyltransferase [Fimbriimonadaceae bacterium]|nr:nucleotidyltransferase [Fimbriimonadaceae bacterium]QOJ12082.1 MAG: nucleotidyltransferase [Chthonomonadaceae bacterium]